LAPEQALAVLLYAMRKRQKDFPGTRARAQSPRRNETLPETEAWRTLRKLEGLPGRFRRQAPIGPYVVDFVCFAAKLVVEIDGGVHRLPEVVERDRVRENWLKAQGFTVVRIANLEAFDPDAVAQRIREAAPHPPPPLPQGEGG
jgi:very-short-patch-repair endonuclease